MGDKKTGVKYVKMFTTAMLVYMAVTSAIAYLSDQIIQYDYPLTLANILGAIGFQLFLTGPSEEILFRALPISVITRVIPSTKGTRAKRLHISWATIISAVFFSLAHIKWTLSPLSVGYDSIQLLFSLLLGVMYGVVYQESKSVIYPMIMHSITNVTVVGVGYMLSIWKWSGIRVNSTDVEGGQIAISSAANKGRPDIDPVFRLFA